MWETIDKYDKLKRKPDRCVFYFTETPKGRNHLKETIELTRNFGRRVCTHYYEVGTPEI